MLESFRDTCPCHSQLLLGNETYYYSVGWGDLFYYRDIPLPRFYVGGLSYPSSLSVQEIQRLICLSLLSSPIGNHILSPFLFAPSLAEGSHENHYRICSLADLLFYWESTGMLCEIIFIWRSSLNANSCNRKNTLAWLHQCNITTQSLLKGTLGLRFHVLKGTVRLT